MSENRIQYLQGEDEQKRKQNLIDECNYHLSDLFDCADIMDKEQSKKLFNLCLEFIIDENLDKTFRSR